MSADVINMFGHMQPCYWCEYECTVDSLKRIYISQLDGKRWLCDDCIEFLEDVGAFDSDTYDYPDLEEE